MKLGNIIYFSISFIIAMPHAIAQPDDDKPLFQLQREYEHLETDLREKKAQKNEIEKLKKIFISIKEIIKNYKYSGKYIDYLNAIEINIKKKDKKKTLEELQKFDEIFDQELSGLAEKITTLNSEIRVIRGPLSSVLNDQFEYFLRSFNNKIYMQQDRLITQVREGNWNSITTEFSKFIKMANQVGLENGIIKNLEKINERIQTELETLENHIKVIEPKIATKTRQLVSKEQGQIQIDKALLTYALPSFAVLLIILLIAPRLYTNVEVQKSILGSGLLLELITVFLLTATTLLLGLSGKIDGDILGTLLGGISGYVLGRARTGAGSDKEKENVVEVTS